MESTHYDRGSIIGRRCSLVFHMPHKGKQMPETFLYSPRKDHKEEPRQKDAGDSTPLHYFDKLMSYTGVVQLLSCGITGVVGFFELLTMI